MNEKRYQCPHCRAAFSTWTAHSIGKTMRFEVRTACGCQFTVKSVEQMETYLIPNEIGGSPQHSEHNPNEKRTEKEPNKEAPELPPNAKLPIRNPRARRSG